MRPERFCYEMDRAFEHWFATGNADSFKPLLGEMKRVWKKWAKKYNDSRSGHETYGYESTESVANNMIYISDRWRCAFRLKWLLDGIEQNKI